MRLVLANEVGTSEEMNECKIYILAQSDQIPSLLVFHVHHFFPLKWKIRSNTVQYWRTFWGGTGRLILLELISLWTACTMNFIPPSPVHSTKPTGGGGGWLGAAVEPMIGVSSANGKLSVELTRCGVNWANVGGGNVSWGGVCYLWVNFRWQHNVPQKDIYTPSPAHPTLPCQLSQWGGGWGQLSQRGSLELIGGQLC